jgi:hypothetical protein
VLQAPGNVGFSAGLNLALTELPESAPYLLLLNPDVFVDPDTLEKTVEVLSADHSLGAVTCKVVRPEGNIDPACRRSDPTLLSGLSRYLGLQALFPRSRLLGRYNLTYLDPNRQHEVDSGTAAYLLIRRDALVAAGGGMDERFFLYGEDLDLCRRIRAGGYRILYWPHVRAVHVKGSGRPRSPRATFEFHRAMWIYYRKWGTHRRNVLVLVPLFGAIAALGVVELVQSSLRTLRRGTDVEGGECDELPVQDTR